MLNYGKQTVMQETDSAQWFPDLLYSDGRKHIHNSTYFSNMDMENIPIILSTFGYHVRNMLGGIVRKYFFGGFFSVFLSTLIKHGSIQFHSVLYFNKYFLHNGQHCLSNLQHGLLRGFVDVN